MSPYILSPKIIRLKIVQSSSFVLYCVAQFVTELACDVHVALVLYIFVINCCDTYINTMTASVCTVIPRIEAALMCTVLPPVEAGH